MDYSDIIILHKTNPTLLALRKSWSPLAVAFLFQAFKQKHEVAIPQADFRERLDQFIDYINRSKEPNDQILSTADHFIDRWSREDDLIRIRAQSEDYIVQLSPHAERLIGWFEEMLSQKFIGTESRLRNILSLLEDVVSNSIPNAEERLEQLKQERKKINAQIKHIQATGEVDQLSDVQIRERLSHISEMSSQLLRDFSLVEERFREMTRAVQQAQLELDTKRGDIIGSALTADEQIQESDEGQSFRAFYELLTHPQQRNKFDELISSVHTLPQLNQFQDENTILLRLTAHLLNAGERVNQSNRRLAEHLRRVVDTRNLLERRRVQSLAREIKHLFGRLDPDDVLKMGPRRIFFELEGEPDIEMPLERPLFDPPEAINISAPPRTAPATIDLDILTTLYSTFYIDNGRLLENIERLLMSRPQITLGELTSIYPITQGIAEIVGYVVIAADQPQHQIERDRSENILISRSSNPEHSNSPEHPHDKDTTLAVPLIVFNRINVQS